MNSRVTFADVTAGLDRKIFTNRAAITLMEVDAIIPEFSFSPESSGFSSSSKLCLPERDGLTSFVLNP